MKLHDRIHLKKITEEDLPQLYYWRNQKEIRKVMMNSDVITWDQHSSWYRTYVDNQNSITKIFYFDNIPYGVLNVYDIDTQNQRCQWGFYIGNLSAPRGIGSILGYASLQYIFDALDVRKVFAEVISFNEKSIRFHHKLGFVEEGILRKHLLKDKEYIDLYLFGILRAEWEEKRNELLKSIEGRFI